MSCVHGASEKGKKKSKPDVEEQEVRGALKAGSKSKTIISGYGGECRNVEVKNAVKHVGAARGNPFYSYATYA